jgi:hypothetical protein
MSRLFDLWMSLPARTRMLLPIFWSGFALLLSTCAIVLTLIDLSDR